MHVGERVYGWIRNNEEVNKDIIRRRITIRTRRRGRRRRRRRRRRKELHSSRSAYNVYMRLISFNSSFILYTIQMHTFMHAFYLLPPPLSPPTQTHTNLAWVSRAKELSCIDCVALSGLHVECKISCPGRSLVKDWDSPIALSRVACCWVG